jgi:hypothetical protein
VETTAVACSKASERTSVTRIVTNVQCPRFATDEEKVDVGTSTIFGDTTGLNIPILPAYQPFEPRTCP